MALLATDSLWNVYALIDSLEAVPGVLWGEPNQLIGAPGRIIYNKVGNDRFYTFWFQWNDCFDGCDNAHAWKFKVYDDCSVEYLGFEDWGVFEILPLPEPVNCNLFSGFQKKMAFSGVYIYPNPVNDKLVIVSETDEIYEGALYNCYGMILSKMDVRHLTAVDFSALTSGFYMISLRNASGQAGTYMIIKK
jgi:hypothetical protein